MKLSPWTTRNGAIQHNRFALVILAAAVTNAVGAQPNPEDLDAGFEQLPAISADELNALRGGFEYAGMKFDFGANLRTFVDGRLALETVIRYTDGGVQTQHQPLPNTVDQPASVPATTEVSTLPDPNAAPVSTTGESVQVLGNGDGPSVAALNLPGIDLSGLKDATGILINDRKGALLALHEATRDRITSLVVNQASGRDIRQELDIGVTVQNFQQFRDAMRGALLSSRLSATPR